MQRHALGKGLPIPTFCRKAKSCSSAAENLISTLKNEFVEIFTPGLGKCTKMAAELKLKQNMQPVFIRKRNVPFASLDKINQELDRLENVGIGIKSQSTMTALIFSVSTPIEVLTDTKDLRLGSRLHPLFFSWSWTLC